MPPSIVVVTPTFLNLIDLREDAERLEDIGMLLLSSVPDPVCVTSRSRSLLSNAWELPLRVSAPG